MMTSNFNAKSAKAVWRNIAVAVFAMVFALLGLGVTVLPTRAATGDFVVVGEIYGRAGNIQKLYDLIGGAEHTTFTQIKELATATTNAANIRANTYQKTNAQDVQVTFGGQLWDVVYLSMTNEENPRPILTLWLHDPIGSYQWNTWLYNSVSIKYPCNMYGTSFVRALINNGGKYTTDKNATEWDDLADYEPVADYVLQEFLTDGKYGDLIVTPSFVDVQKNGESFGYVFHNSKTIANCPNENWGDVTYPFTSGFNYSGREGNDIWKDDNLWLPSLSEQLATTRAIWRVSANQRSTWHWTRSTGVENIQQAFYGGTDGQLVTQKAAVRPALHLDLAALNLTADNLDDITVTYDANDQNIANWENQPEWYSDSLRITYTQDGTEVPAVKDVGEYTVTVQWGDFTNTITMTVLPQEVTVTGTFTAVDRTYDQKREVELIKNITETGLTGTDGVSIEYKGFMDDKNAGENKHVTITATLTGDNAKNYTLLTPQFETTVNIDPQTIAINNIVAKDKEYDGTKQAILDITNLTYTPEIFKGDDLTIWVNVEFEQATVGNNLKVTVDSATLDGKDKNNYKLGDINDDVIKTTASIRPRAITVTIKDQVVKEGTKTDLTYSITSGSIVGGDKAETIFTLGLLGGKELDNLPVGEYQIVGTEIDNPNYDVTFANYGTYRVLSAEEWDALQPKEEPKDNNMWLIIIIVMAIAAFIGALVGIGLVIRSHDKNRDPKPKKEKQDKKQATDKTADADEKK